MKRSVRYFDRHVAGIILKLPEWTCPLMLFVTLLGQPPITVGFAAGVIGFGIARGSEKLIVIGILAILTFGVSSLMKILLRRARPDNEYVRNMIIHTYSFPSGHAAGSVASFGLAALIGCIVIPAWAVVIIVLSVLLCFLIGVSRVFLGAHYPSDVIGGWLVGILGMIPIIIEGLR